MEINPKNGKCCWSCASCFSGQDDSSECNITHASPCVGRKCYPNIEQQLAEEKAANEYCQTDRVNLTEKYKAALERERELQRRICTMFAKQLSRAMVGERPTDEEMQQMARDLAEENGFDCYTNSEIPNDSDDSKKETTGSEEE